mmetsp:Transcript_40422/g.100525  ORF Transcript_40422/g.100525 Transcript_40422/m.100525 type:complete len:391 (-) Transcript_40422:52-1224(-)
MDRHGDTCHLNACFPVRRAASSPHGSCIAPRSAPPRSRHHSGRDCASVAAACCVLARHTPRAGSVHLEVERGLRALLQQQLVKGLEVALVPRAPLPLREGSLIDGELRGHRDLRARLVRVGGERRVERQLEHLHGAPADLAHRREGRRDVAGDLVPAHVEAIEVRQDDGGHDLDEGAEGGARALLRALAGLRHAAADGVHHLEGVRDPPRVDLALHVVRRLLRAGGVDGERSLRAALAREHGAEGHLTVHRRHLRRDHKPVQQAVDARRRDGERAEAAARTGDPRRRRRVVREDAAHVGPGRVRERRRLARHAGRDGAPERGARQRAPHLGICLRCVDLLAPQRARRADGAKVDHVQVASDLKDAVGDDGSDVGLVLEGHGAALCTSGGR